MKSFSDIFIDCTSAGMKIPKEAYLDAGAHIIIDQGQNEIAGYTNEETGLYTDVPAIIFGDHTRAVKYVEEPFFLGADGVKLLKSKVEDANYKYLYYALKNAKIPDTGYNRHFKWLKEIEINYPVPSVQSEIVKTLDSLTTIISYRENELSKLDELIKARFVEMFGNPVTDSMNWGQRPLKDMLVSIRYGTSTPPQFTNEGYDFIRATNIKNGHIVHEDMKHIPQFEADRLEKCKLSGGEIIIVRSGVNAGDTCVVTDEYIGQYAGYDMILVLNELLNPVFFNTLVNTDYMDRVVKPLTRRAAQPHLNSEQTQSFPVICVPRDLQDQFAKFVEQVDKSKSVVQKSLNEVQLLFDSLMQQYFG